jgi:hypothetical protein
MHTEGHDKGKETAGHGTHGAPGHKFDAEHPGYETEDVNVHGIAVFLAGLFGTVIVFFFFCFGMGRVINNLWKKQDGNPNQWKLEAGVQPYGAKREDLTSNAELKQRELQQMTTAFPEPRLDLDDGNQATADLHAREDLLLEHYSTVEGTPGMIRIPIERAMELIAQRGLPVVGGAAATGQMLAGDSKPAIQAPLTTGFARTGYELTVIEAREQRMNYGRAVASADADQTPAK